ncbi:MAG: hypothetical protein ABGW50_06405, partial [Thermococcus sp.]
MPIYAPAPILAPPVVDTPERMTRAATPEREWSAPAALDATRDLYVETGTGERVALPDHSQFDDPAFALQANIVVDRIYKRGENEDFTTYETAEEVYNAALEGFKTEDYDPATDNLFNEKWVSYLGKSLSVLGG